MKDVCLLDDPERSALEMEGSMLRRESYAVLTLAGGEGTRLGCKEPKGLFRLSVGGMSKSLFQMQLEKVPETSTWIVMVSPRTRVATTEHLKELLQGPVAPSSLKGPLQGTGREVFLIEQEEVPCIDFNGNVLLDTSGNPVTSPNGNGCLFKALRTRPTRIFSGKESNPESLSETQEEETMLDILKKRNALAVNIVSIDNVLVKILDPCQIALLKRENLDVVHSGVPIPEGAKMGTFFRENGTIHVREYLDADKNDTSSLILTSKGGPLGNIANHLVTLRFLESVNPENLEYHKSPKKIPHAGNPNPTENTGYKQELFLFDAFSKGNTKVGVVEYTENAYEGLKNKEGKRDSIESCVSALNRQITE